MIAPEPPQRPTVLRILALAYVLLLVYGTLFPLTEWRPPGGAYWHTLWASWPRRVSRSDLLVNFLVYLPFGLLVTRLLRARLLPAGSIALATLSALLLSFTLEYLQGFLPGRVSSPVDLLTNTIGALVGALLAFFLASETALLKKAIRWREEQFLPGTLSNLGLATLGLWALSQLTPLVPSVDVGLLWEGMRPLYQTLTDLSRFNIPKALHYALDVIALGLLTTTLARPGKRTAFAFFVFAATVLALKIPVLNRQLSLEAVIGLLVGWTVYGGVLRFGHGVRIYLAIVSIAVSYALHELQTEATLGATLYTFNWIPFGGHISLTGISSILENLWPFMALSCLLLFAGYPHRRAVAKAGALLVALGVFGLEWSQQFLPGRFPDITNVLIALLGWTLPWVYASTAAAHDGIPHGKPSPSPGPWEPSQRYWSIPLAGLTLILVAVLVGWAASRPPVEVRVNEDRLPILPAPAELATVDLPNFHYSHPRLPAPSNQDISILRAENPGFIQGHRKRAAQGRGKMESSILMALIEPGSQNLDLLYHRLMALEFRWRGHQQGKLLALAYDWLYEQWSASQRAQLRIKLLDGCDYLIKVIREQRLSPYNVFLYNSPFQALVAGTLATYGDDPRGNAIMAFTYDLWKNRVLPVWRQIMGKNGGWHEGGEYVGIGIGQAIYQVPAMWHNATGEDLFASEPEIRGFLDFLVYRTRPDSTHFRWGDAAVAKRRIPDRIPLAIEYHHAAAYSLGPPKGRPAPTAWPWGPFPVPELNDPAAISRLPLSKYFDGLGLLVARSDWTPDATYVTFKAGDNFWSHSHLDQGAFTIYKGGALAIDSGLYGPKYGSDHHMNYTYQTIAHNVITVTDPADTVPAPGKKKSGPRPIANDGGQRRVGSGWGVEAAPLDRNEWEEKRDIYHTGLMKKILAENGLLIAIADLTPAYTNKYSGKGTFSHRTRRVESYQRIFAYDRIADAIIVFDKIRASKPRFRQRWLLHTIEQPSRTKDGFLVTVPPTKATGHNGGRLEAHVLLPKQANINFLGGKGFEFFVAGKNYDENGAVLDTVRKKRGSGVEPGAWRIEVSPSSEAHEDTFLTVLLPTIGENVPGHQVRSLDEGGRPGCEIIGRKRTTRWWFDPRGHGVRVEVRDGATVQNYDLSTTAPNITTERSLSRRIYEFFFFPASEPKNP